MSNLLRGSLQDIATNNRQSLAQAFMGAKALVLVDVSSSMNDQDCPGGRRRFDVARDELIKLQKQMPGEIAVIPWANNAYFAPSGLPTEAMGGTDMVQALQFIKPADGCGLKIILISDGEPNQPEETIKVASTFQTKIDTLYIGPEWGSGRDFMRRLAQVTGGTAVSQSVKDICLLSETVSKLLQA